MTEKRRRRKTPEQDAVEHILLGEDKPFLEGKFINKYKGRGVFTKEYIEPKTFVVEYRGVLSLSDASDDKYIFDFMWNGKRYWMLYQMNMFLTPTLVITALMRSTYLEVVMDPAQIKMVKMIPYLFNPVLMMNPKTLPLQAIPNELDVELDEGEQDDGDEGNGDSQGEGDDESIRANDGHGEYEGGRDNEGGGDNEEGGGDAEDGGDEESDCALGDVDGGSEPKQEEQRVARPTAGAMRDGLLRWKPSGRGDLFAWLWCNWATAC
ncbi:hypothetical protein INR49_018741 [Caranx melampygus]|nr:hypothetical protein INR49_018741 [Caranx melampygus]